MAMNLIKKWKQRGKNAVVLKEENGNNTINVPNTGTYHSSATQTNINGFILAKYLVLIKNLPVFGGRKNENFAKFMQQLENVTAGENDQTKLEILQLRFYGHATETLDKILESQSNIKWITLVQKLDENFSSNDQVCNLKAYAAATRKMVNKNYSNNNGFTQQQRDGIMIKNFMDSIPAELQENLKSRMDNFNNLNDLLQQAMEFQQQYINGSKQQQLHSTT
jgi:hypothetical protein